MCTQLTSPAPNTTPGDGPRREAHLAGGRQVGGDLLLRGGRGKFLFLHCMHVWYIGWSRSTSKLTQPPRRPIIIIIARSNNGQNGDYELCIGNGVDGRVDDGVARRVGFSFRTDVLVDEDIANEGEPACACSGWMDAVGSFSGPWIVRNLSRPCHAISCTHREHPAADRAGEPADQGADERDGPPELHAAARGPARFEYVPN